MGLNAIGNFPCGRASPVADVIAPPGQCVAPVVQVLHRGAIESTTGAGGRHRKFATHIVGTSAQKAVMCCQRGRCWCFLSSTSKGDFGVGENIMGEANLRSCYEWVLGSEFDAQQLELRFEWAAL